MEEDLKKNENGIFLIEDKLNFLNRRRTSFSDTGRGPQFFEDGRRPHFYLNGRRPKKYWYN
jgi:hypothetical protein